MDLTFRLPGPWGAGKGTNLQPTEVDNNFWELAEAILDLQSNPAQPVGIASISVSGTQMTITLTDSTVMGPFTLPVLTFRWRGEWVPLAAYAELDVFTVLNVGIFMAVLDHTSGATFDPDIAVAGEPALQQLFGSADASLSALPDVELTDLADQDFLQWDDATDRWVNVALGTMALQEANNVNITGGQIHGMPNPSLAGDVANKAYVDALPLGMSIADARMMANISGMIGPALPNTLSDFLDYALLASARGTVLYRGGAGWAALAPGTSGHFLKTLGAGADPAWSVGGSGVTSITAGAGIDTTPDTIVASGSVALAAVADNSILANVSGGSAAPSAATLTALLDHVASSTRGAILTRAGSGWVALAPGTSGYYLQTQGSTADAVWSSPSGSGTVTSVSAGTGISTGGAPITGAGTVSLAAIATASVLANISGGSAAPVPATVSVLFDSVFGSTQGAVVYRNASAWVMLSPGTSGQILTTAGASANPSWQNAPAAPAIGTALILSNISGSTAVPIGNSLSNIFDSILGSSRGMVVYRGAAGWAALAPGTAGQVLTTGGAAGDPSWAAAAASGASITTSDTPPASPADGDAWWDSVGGQLYIRYDDGSSSQWVPATNQGGITVPLPVAQGGTGSTTAAAALTALGAFPAAGGIITGSISVGGNTAAQFGVEGGATALFAPAGTGHGAIYLFSDGASQHRNASHVFLTANGLGTFLTVDSSACAASVQISSTAGYRVRAGTPGPFAANVFNINWTGAAVLWIDGTNAGNITLTSDYRVKENVLDLPGMWEQVKALRPVSYTIKENEALLSRASADEQWGFIAHELQDALIPSAATGYKDAPDLIQSPNVMVLLAPLVKALQEAMSRIEALEARP